MSHPKIKAVKPPAGEHISNDVPLHMSYIKALMIPGPWRRKSQKTRHLVKFPMKATQSKTRKEIIFLSIPNNILIMLGLIESWRRRGKKE